MYRLSYELTSLIDLAGLPRKGLYTVQETAKILEADDATIYRWIQDGRLMAIKPCHHFRITGYALDQLLIDRRSDNLQGVWHAT